MAIDHKYGRVQLEHSTIGEDEPVIVFRAQDKLLVPLLDAYAKLCREEGSPDHHLDLIATTKGIVQEWQHKHADQVRIPNSNAYMERVANEST
jgi:hypothetical protein